MAYSFFSLNHCISVKLYCLLRFFVISLVSYECFGINFFRKYVFRANNSAFIKMLFLQFHKITVDICMLLHYVPTSVVIIAEYVINNYKKYELWRI